MKREQAVRRERGAVAVMVSAFLGGGVVLAMLALTVDVGNLMYERRQLQNGADAVAMKMVNLCSANISNCNPLLPATDSALDAMNGANAGDGAAALNGTRTDTAGGNGICGRVPGASNIAACNSEVTDPDIRYLPECPPMPSWLKAPSTVKYVEAHSVTATTGSIAGAIAAWFSDSSTTVKACSRVAWGPAGSASVMPLSFSECEWNATAALGFGVETSLPLKYSNAATTVCDSYKGRDYDGGFGWLVHSTGTCQMTVDANKWVEADTGVGAGNDCIPQIVPGQIIYIPIFDCINKTKTLCVNDAQTPTTYYHIAGLAAFQVTAVRITGPIIGSAGAAATTECQNESLDNKCIFGKFIKDLVPVGTIDTTGGATDYGISVAQQVG